jgi:hypothetical protein
MKRVFPTLLPSIIAAALGAAVILPFHPGAAIGAGFLHLFLAGGARILGGIVMTMWVLMTTMLRLAFAAMVAVLFPSLALPFVIALIIALVAEALFEYFLAARKVAHA